MPEPRHIAAALAGAFIIGTVSGGILLSGGGSTAGSTIPFNPAAEDSADPADASTATTTKKADKVPGAFTAQAEDQGSRVVITGEGAQPGAKLVVQRKEAGGWQDFPARATATGDGSYSTYIITSRDGTFRLKDTSSDAASEPVDVKR